MITKKEAKILYEATGELRYKIILEMVDNPDDDLREFLLARESDIALEMENFNTLESVFRHVIGRVAEAG